LKEASRSTPKNLESEFECIQEAIRLADNALTVCRILCVPKALLYRPPEGKVRNAEKVDYLGRSKVVAAIDERDSFVGFSGKKWKAETLSRRPSAPETSPTNFTSSSPLRELSISDIREITRRPSVSDQPISPNLSRTLSNGGDSQLQSSIPSPTGSSSIRRPSRSNTTGSRKGPPNFRGRQSSLANVIIPTSSSSYQNSQSPLTSPFTPVIPIERPIKGQRESSSNKSGGRVDTDVDWLIDYIRQSPPVPEKQSTFNDTNELNLSEGRSRSTEGYYESVDFRSQSSKSSSSGRNDTNMSLDEESNSSIVSIIIEYFYTYIYFSFLFTILVSKILYVCSCCSLKFNSNNKTLVFLFLIVKD